jgi:predicted HicB family RNase H-like nuclease
MIRGINYNTEISNLIHAVDGSVNQELYYTITKRFFLVQRDEYSSSSDTIVPLTEIEAHEWLFKHARCKLAELLRSSRGTSGTTMRMKKEYKDALQLMALLEQTSMNAFCTRILNKAAEEFIQSLK